MKLEICSFSSKKIYPGHGRLFIRSDGRLFRFIDYKSAALFSQRKNPRKVAWTVMFRRMHRKGTMEEVKKKKTRRTVKHQRGIVGASFDDIQSKRNQKPEVRAAARQEAIEKAKQTKKNKKSTKAN
ncbi:60S ribosomal protein L24, partial [Dimargaris verticillata]